MSKSRLGLLLVGVALTGTVMAAPFENWLFRSKITFSGYEGEGTLENFPALVVLNGTTITGFDAASCEAGGADLRFTDAAGNEIPFEIDKWDSSGTSHVWVRVPELASASDYIQLYWGKSEAEMPAYASDGSVWATNYTAVWHMNSGSPADATGKGNDGTGKNGVGTADGLVGQALDLNGTSHYVDCGRGLNMRKNDATLGIWFKTGTPKTRNFTLIGKTVASGVMRYGIYGTSGHLLRAYFHGNAQRNAEIPWQHSDDKWHHVAVTFKRSGNMTLYIDGRLATAPVSIGDQANQDLKNDTIFFIGVYGDSTGKLPGDKTYFPGALDEGRLMSAAASADWILAEYMNIASNSHFISYGTAEMLVMEILGSDGAPVANWSTASAVNGTDFGLVVTNSVGLERTFIITNRGDAAFNITSDPAVVVVSGDSEFTIETYPDKTALNPGQSSTFTVRFAPQVLRRHEAAIALETDFDRGPIFSFQVAGVGDSGARMDVWGTNGVGMVTALPPSAEHGTDFGLLALYAPVDLTHVFTITNSGTHDLILESVDFAAGPAFTLDPPIAGTVITPQDSATFGVRFATATAGVHTAQLVVSNNTAAGVYIVNFAAVAENMRQHVAPDGDDANDGFAWASAKASVAAAVAAVSEGGEVLISNGIYRLIESVTIAKGITVKGYGGNQDTTITRETGYETRLMVLDHPQAVVSDLCLSNGYGRALSVNAHSYGGAVWIKKGSLARCIVTHSTSKGDAVGKANHNYHGYGGGVYMATGSITDCEIRNNTARGSGGSANGYGGGIAYAAGEVAGCVILNNSTAGTGNGSGIGGGVYITGAGRLLNSAVNQNKSRAASSASCNGGGIYMSGNGLVSNAVVTLNDVNYLIPHGGGIYATAGIITHSLIASNLAECASSASYDTKQTPTGAGVFLSGTAQLHNSIVLRNRAVHPYQYRMGETLGAGVFVSETAKVYHSTIVGNYGGERGYGDGVYISGGELKNSIASHNFANFESGAYTLNHHNVWQAGGTVSYNVLPRSRLTAPGVGNVAADPGFVNVYAGDLSLGPGSPAIDAATVIAGMASDFSGVTRPLNGSGAESALPDIGALEAPPLNQGSLRVNFTLSQEDAFDSVNVTLQAHVAGAALGSLIYHWDLDGDGVADTSGSDKDNVTHLFDEIGYHDIGLRVVSSGAGEAVIFKHAAVRVTPSVLYLSNSGTSEAPYNTPDKASAVLQDIVTWADDNAEIRVAPGAYKITTKPVTLRRAIRVIGSGNTTTAVERDPSSTTRLFIMAHEGAELSNLTLRNGNWSKSGMAYGGAVWMLNGLIDSCIVTNNNVHGQPNQPGHGGAIYMSGGTLRNSLISRNSSGSSNSDSHGGGVYMSGGQIEHCTIVSNRVTKSAGLGGGVYQNGGTIVNTIAYCNWISGAAVPVRNIQAASGKLNVSNSCASELTHDPDGTGNINGDPQFVNPGKGDWRLAQDSPCINAAAMLPWSADGSDITGGPRRRGVRADMGAYETQRMRTTVLLLR